MALRAMADVAVNHRFIGRQDGMQELLLWVHLHAEIFRRWSAEARHRGYVLGASSKILTDAIRQARRDGLAAARHARIEYRRTQTRNPS
jgi:hypothetical protein